MLTFDPVSFNVTFVVDGVAVRQVFLRFIQVSCQYQYTSAP
jgi:hypothetical protein